MLREGQPSHVCRKEEEVAFADGLGARGVSPRTCRLGRGKHPVMDKDGERRGSRAWTMPVEKGASSVCRCCSLFVGIVPLLMFTNRNLNGDRGNVGLTVALHRGEREGRRDELRPGRGCRSVPFFPVGSHLSSGRTQTNA